MALPKRYARLVGSKWTSAAPLLGWRQFHVISLRRGGKRFEAELAASVDPSERVWVDTSALTDPTCWRTGWATLGELRTCDTEEAPVRAGAREGPDPLRPEQPGQSARSMTGFGHIDLHKPVSVG